MKLTSATTRVTRWEWVKFRTGALGVGVVTLVMNSKTRQSKLNIIIIFIQTHTSVQKVAISHLKVVCQRPIKRQMMKKIKSKNLQMCHHFGY